VLVGLRPKTSLEYVVSVLQAIILAVVQGLAELLPVSSSAHVVVAEKVMGLDPSSPPMTLLLVMLHAGTMAAVIVYFWQRWRGTYFRSMAAFKEVAGTIILATALTGLIGEGIIKVIEKTILRNTQGAQIEDLFSHLEIVAPALAVGGLLILIAGVLARQGSTPSTIESPGVNIHQAGLIGTIQGLCLPFRGFSRSGATISVGMLAGVPKSQAEAFSFALAVVLTPAVVAREAVRLLRVHSTGGTDDLVSAFAPSLLGAVFAFLAGLVALKWLSRWLEGGRWYLFGIYCMIAAAIVFALHRNGF
jgi:undecaprenyl-diphosphatase